MSKMILTENLESHIKSKLDDLVLDHASEYESYSEVETAISEIEHEARDGFFPYTNGGLTSILTVELSHVSSTGVYPGNDEIKTRLDNTIENDLQSALINFCETNKEQLKPFFTMDQLEKPDHNVINYHDLCETGQSNLAEILSETETEIMNEGGEFFLQHHVIYFAADNSRNETGEDEVFFTSGVNLDYEYGRDSGFIEQFGSTIKVSDLTTKSIDNVFKKMAVSI